MILDTPPAGVPEAADEIGRDRRCDPILRSGAADDVHSDAGQAPSLGIHADAAGRSGKDRPAGFNLRIAEAVEDRSRALARSSAPWSTRSIPRWRPTGGAVDCCSPAIRRTRCRRFSGQGMCSGLRDAANLAWKLRDVIAGRASDQLLDSYETERMEHVRAYIELAVELGGVIQATDPESARPSRRRTARQSDHDEAVDAASRARPAWSAPRRRPARAPNNRGSATASEWMIASGTALRCWPRRSCIDALPDNGQRPHR